MIQPIFEKIKSLLQPKPVRTDGARLYAACVAQARQPAFYTDYGIDDAIGARFELLTFHVGLVIERLKSIAANDSRRPRAAELAQALFDSFLEALDNTLREQGTGDLTVPKKMKKLGGIVYTRMRRWDDLWHEGAEAQADYAARTLFAGDAYEAEEGAEASVSSARHPKAFADYAASARAAIDLDALLRGKLAWISVPALTAADNTESA